MENIMESANCIDGSMAVAQCADSLHAAVENLPKAKLALLDFAGFENPLHLQAVIVDNKVAAVVSSKYGLVQHSDAFKPIVEGIRASNVPFHYRCFAYGELARKAYLDVITTETYDTVRVGFRVANSIDGTSAIRYSFSMIKETNTVELVGYRQVCSNGMKIRVPLAEAEFVEAEERQKIEQLLAAQKRIVHSKDALEKVRLVQVAVEAISLLREPVARIIQAAQRKEITKEESEKLLEKYIGKNLKDRILDQFVGNKEKSLWSLYNAVTYVASHGTVAQSTQMGLIDRSAKMLEQELTVKEGA